MKANLSTGIVHQDYVIFGFHLGSIAIYSTLEESPEELSRFKVSKRGDPVLDMHVTDSRLFVLTRDGKYSIFCLDDFPELTLLEVVTTIETPARFYFEPINDQRFIWGFRGSEFALSSIDTPVPFVSFECGGGNRILDLSPTYRKGKLTGFKYEYIARGVLQLVDFDLPLVQHIRGPYHKFTIFGLTIITHPEMPSILTAGVDTEIQLHVVDDQGIARRKWTSSFHSSSVHSLASLQTTKNEVLVSSCGGNSQVKVWKASKDSLKVQAEFQGTPTFRYVSNAMVEFNGRIFIFAAASIRELHFFEFLVPEKKVDRLKIWENVEYSTFIKVDCFATNENICLFAAATSGFAYCFEWNPSNDNDIQFIQVKCLDCGLSAICSMKEDKLAATGGESGEICLVDFAKEEVAAKLDNVHFSTIPDIC
uniref:Uncharacterized protein n=1 Tax=Panagrolaimus sp. JU765 TaxID=591449 RepID=A0AC34RHY5_9BILA